jgi:hypothetical protein
MYVFNVDSVDGLRFSKPSSNYLLIPNTARTSERLVPLKVWAISKDKQGPN